MKVKKHYSFTVVTVPTALDDDRYEARATVDGDILQLEYILMWCRKDGVIDWQNPSGFCLDRPTMSPTQIAESVMLVSKWFSDLKQPVKQRGLFV